MGTRVVINQPYYFPLLHWWNRAINCDVLVYLDDVHHNTNYPVNRTAVFDGKKQQYLTVPLPKKQRRNKINEISILNNDWINKHIHLLKCYYDNTENIISLINKCYSKNLSDIIINSIEEVNTQYCIGLPQRIRSSSLNLSSQKNDRLIDICKSVEADTLVLGLGSKDYIHSELQKYKDNNISIVFQDWECPVDNNSILHGIIKYEDKIKEVIR